MKVILAGLGTRLSEYTRLFLNQWLKLLTNQLFIIL